MSSRTMYKYRYFCTSENTFKYVWSDKPPSTCTNDISDVIDGSSITIVDSISQNTVVVQNDTNNTSGYYMLEGVTFAVPSQSNFVFSTSSPVGISCLNVYCYPSNSNVGDMISIYTKLPGFPLASNLSIGSSNIYMYPQIADFIQKGYEVSLSNDNLGPVVDKDLNHLITQYTASNDYPAGEHFETRVYFAKNLVMPISKTYTVGKGTFNGTYVPKNTPIYIAYNNKDMQEKDFTVHVEYTY